VVIKAKIALFNKSVKEEEGLDHVQKLWGMEEIKTFADKF